MGDFTTTLDTSASLGSQSLLRLKGLARKRRASGAVPQRAALTRRKTWALMRGRCKAGRSIAHGCFLDAVLFPQRTRFPPLVPKIVLI